MGLFDRFTKWLRPDTKPQSQGYRTAAPVGFWWQNYNDRPMFTLWLADQMQYDYQVAIGLAIGESPLYKAKVKIESEYPEVAEFVGKTWDKIWSSHAWQFLLARRYGWMGYEVNYVIHPNGQYEFGSVSDFHPRDTRPVINADGAMIGINVYGRRYGIDNQTSADAVACLRGPKALWLRYEYKHGELFGRSALEKAYAPWWDKSMKVGALALRRLRNVKDSWIGDVVKVPFSRPITDADGNTYSLADIAQRIVENRMSGGVLVLPSETYEDGKPLCEYQPPTSVTGSAGIDDWIHDLDSDILDGLLVPREVMEASTTGSGYSGRAIPMQAFLSMRDKEFSIYVDAINKGPLSWLVMANFGLPASSYSITPEPLAETLKDDLNPPKPQSPFGFQQQPDDGAMQFSADDVLQFAAEHAPAGGITIAGKKFKGGEFIPSEYHLVQSLSEQVVSGKMSKSQASKQLKSAGHGNMGTALSDSIKALTNKSAAKPAANPDMIDKPKLTDNQKAAYDDFAKGDHAKAIRAATKNASDEAIESIVESGFPENADERDFLDAVESAERLTSELDDADAKASAEESEANKREQEQAEFEKYSTDEKRVSSDLDSYAQQAQSALDENRYSDREEKRLLRADVQKPAVHKMLLADGYSFERMTKSGSLYYRKGDDLLRVSDHEVPATAERLSNAKNGGFSWADSENQIILPVNNITGVLQFSVDSENTHANSIDNRMAKIATAFQSEIRSSIRNLLKKND